MILREFSPNNVNFFDAATISSSNPPYYPTINILTTAATVTSLTDITYDIPLPDDNFP